MLQEDRYIQALPSSEVCLRTHYVVEPTGGKMSENKLWSTRIKTLRE